MSRHLVAAVLLALSWFPDLEGELGLVWACGYTTCADQFISQMVHAATVRHQVPADELDYLIAGSCGLNVVRLDVSVSTRVRAAVLATCILSEREEQYGRLKEPPLPQFFAP